MIGRAPPMVLYGFHVYLDHGWRKAAGFDLIGSTEGSGTTPSLDRPGTGNATSLWGALWRTAGALGGSWVAVFFKRSLPSHGQVTVSRALE